MANFKYFNGTTEVQYGWLTMRNEEFARRFPGVAGLRSDSFSKFVGKVGNEYVPVTRRIEYKSRPSLHKCDARCMNAKRGICECECGGKNHGAGFSCEAVAA